MLVKLGEVWVDPQQVIYISCAAGSVSLSVSEDGYMGAIPIAFPSSLEEAANLRDEYASIVNSALGTQSFGGPPDEEAESK